MPLVPGHVGHQRRRVIRQAVAPPGHMLIGTDRHQIAAAEVARRRARHVAQTERNPALVRCGDQRRDNYCCSAQA